MSFEGKCDGKKRKKRRHFAVLPDHTERIDRERVRKQFPARSCSAFETALAAMLIDTFAPFLPDVRQLESCF